MTANVRRPPIRGVGRWIAWTGVLLLVIALHLPGLLFGASQDAAVYTQVAELLRSGVPPYSGAWDHKPPGVYVVYALAQAALPFLGSWIPVWIASVGAVMSSGLLTSSIARRGGFEAVAIPAGVAVAVLMSLPPIAQGGGHTEALALPFALASILLLLAPGTWRTVILAGTLMGISATMSLQIVPIAAVALALLWLNRSSVRFAAAYAAGGAVVVAATAGILAAFGLLPHAVDAVVEYSAAYRAMNAGHQGRIIIGSIRAGILVSAPLLFPLGVGLLRAVRVKGPSRRFAVANVVWLLLSAGWIGYQVRIEGHYLIPLLPPAAFLLMIGASHLFLTLRQRRIFAIAAIVFTGVLLALSTLVLVVTSRVVWNELKAENARVRAVSASIEARSPQKLTLFVWGNRPQLYYESSSQPASRYFYLAPLTTPGYSTEAQVALVASALREDPPAVIVDAGSQQPGAPGLPPLLIDRPIAANGRDYDKLDPLRDLVRSRYELVGVIEGWPVYVLRP